MDNITLLKIKIPKWGFCSDAALLKIKVLYWHQWFYEELLPSMETVHPLHKKTATANTATYLNVEQQLIGC